MCSDIVKSSKEWIPNVVAENEESGTIVTGDSGEDEGDGSDNDEESAVEMVVVGEESVDSEHCVDVESRWFLCCGLAVGLVFSLPAGGRLISSVNASNLLSVAMSPLLSILLWSKPYTLINDGNWLWYACGPAATGIFGNK
jgi:hypothetical protein